MTTEATGTRLQTAEADPERAMTHQPFSLALPRLPIEPRVVRFTGTEGVNALYAFDVDVRALADDRFVREVLDTPARLTMLSDGATARVVHGLVDACQAGRRLGTRTSTSRHQPGPAWSTWPPQRA
jgi:uncharacterized protein involved in type VI secretion and phage assembly